MPGWGKLVAGVVLGAAGAVYATNEELRKRLPEGARGLPEAVRRRFDAARTAAREASRTRRAEILRELEEHGAEARAAGAAELGGGTSPNERVLPAPLGSPTPEAPLDEAPPEALLDAAPPRPAGEPNERGGSFDERPGERLDERPARTEEV